MYEWVLAMVLLCASYDDPWQRRHEERWLGTDADAIASAVEDWDVPGADLDNPSPAREEIALILIALASREGHFDPLAVAGDQFGHSYGLFQLHDSNFGRVSYRSRGLEHVVRTPEEAFDPYAAAAVAARMVVQSLNACRHLPPEEGIAWYASGRCGVPEGREASRNRLALARRLRREGPALFYEERARKIPKNPRIWDF